MSNKELSEYEIISALSEKCRLNAGQIKILIKLADKRGAESKDLNSNCDILRNMITDRDRIIEKADNQFYQLKDEIATHEIVMSFIDGHCDATGTSTKDDGDPCTRVEMLRDEFIALRYHFGKTKRGREILKQFDRAKKRGKG